MENPEAEQQKNETERAEEIATTFYDMSEKIDPSTAPQTYEMFNEVGREMAQGNYDRGQRILEAGVAWDDNLRSAAVEMNQLEQERKGAEPLSFEDAQNTISRYSEQLEELGTNEDLKAALEVQKIAAGTGKSREAGIEGIDQALTYVEGLLQTKAEFESKSPRQLTAENLGDWEEKRAIRDALYREKQKRIEELRQSEEAASIGSETAPQDLEEMKRRHEEEDESELARLRAELNDSSPEKVEGENKMEERRAKYETFEQEKGSATRLLKALQEMHNNYEPNNNTELSTAIIEDAMTMLLKPDAQGAESLRGRTMDIDREREALGISDTDLGNYIRMRQAQNSLAERGDVSYAVAELEAGLQDDYGVERVDFSGVKDMTELRKMKVDIVGVETDDPNLVGKIKEVGQDGYHIPGVPIMNNQGEVINVTDMDVDARPRVSVYTAKR